MGPLCPENVFTALKLKNTDKQSMKRGEGVCVWKQTTPETDVGYFFWRGASLKLGKEEKVPVMLEFVCISAPC